MKITVVPWEETVDQRHKDHQLRFARIEEAILDLSAGRQASAEALAVLLENAATLEELVSGAKSLQERSRTLHQGFADAIAALEERLAALEIKMNQ